MRRVPREQALMKTLLSDRFAPITSRIGYVNLGLAETVDVLAGWRRGIGNRVTIEDVSQVGFPDALRRLEPLESPSRPRELLVEMAGWTAYFDCGINGTDPIGPVSAIARFARCRGLAIWTIPNTPNRLGAVSWELFADHPTEFVNFERVVGLVNDGSGWTFDQRGTVQGFEVVERYAAKRKRDRFDSELVEAYSKALGVTPFDAYAYGPSIALVMSQNSDPYPDGKLVMTLAEAQARLGIVVGLADEIPGQGLPTP